MKNLCAEYLESYEIIYYSGAWEQFPKNELCRIAITHDLLDLFRYGFENGYPWVPVHITDRNMNHLTSWIQDSRISGDVEKKYNPIF